MPAGWAAAAAVAGSYMSSQAAGDAADQQANSAREASAVSQRQYDQTRADNAGVRARGESAGNRLSYLMGLGNSAGTQQTRDQIRAQLAPGFTSAGTAGTPGSWGNNGGGDAAEQQAANYSPGTAGTAGTIDETGLEAAIARRMEEQRASQEAQSADPAYGSLSRNFNAQDMAADPIYSQLAPGIKDSMAREDGMMNRFASFGSNAGAQPSAGSDRAYAGGSANFNEATGKNLDGSNAGKMAGSAGGDGIMFRRFGMADFVKDPGYDFRMQEGEKSVENTAASRGGLLSGAAMKAMARFGQDFASNEYGNAASRFNADRGYAADQYGNASNRMNTNRNFLAGQGDAAYNRFNNNNSQQYNRLAGVAGSGQQATNFVNSAGAQNAQQIGNNGMDSANAQGAARMFGARQMSNGLNSAYNGYQNNQLMNRLSPQQQPQPGITDDGYGIGQGASYNGNYSRM